MRNRLLRLAELGKIAPPATEYQGRVLAELRKNGFYHELVTRIRHIVETNIPRDSCLLVVSKGDDELVEFDARSALHFPQSLDGRYAGHHPANSIDAIQQLESLKRKGCQYFLFPQTSFWWLDYYKALQSHLQNEYRRILNDPYCIVYQLSDGDARLRKRARSRRDARIRAR